MQNETVGSLFDLLKLSIKKSFSNILFILIVGFTPFFLVTGVFVAILQNLSKDSISMPLIYIPSIAVYIILLVACPYFTAATIATSKDNTIKTQFTTLLNIYTTSRLFKLLLSLILKYIAMALGFLVFIAPYYYIHIRTFVIGFSAILDDSWPNEAFKTSSRITNGSKWKIWLYSIIIYALSFIATYIPSLITTILSVLLLPLLPASTSTGMTTAAITTAGITTVASILAAVYLIEVTLLIQVCLLYLKRR